MGIKRFFKIKPPPEASTEENREYLNEMGISTKMESSNRREKFAAYGKFASDKVKSKVYAPEGYEKYANPGAEPSEEQTLDDLNNSPYDQVSMVNNRNAAANVRHTGNYVDPYGGNSSASPYGGNSASPYGNSSNASPYGDSGSSPYDAGYNAPTQQANPYGTTINNSNVNNNSYSSATPRASSQKPSNPYANMNNQDPYGATSSSRPARVNAYKTTSASASASASAVPSTSNSVPKRSVSKDREFNFERAGGEDEIDLNDTIRPDTYSTTGAQGNGFADDDDLNNSIHENDGIGYSENKGYQTFDELQRENEHAEKQEEDEEVDGIKQQIRFTKQSSVASTRNTLKMAQDAELAGMNTIGMLGHQSEKLNTVERNLNLMQIQNRNADDKVSELKKLNRNILAVHVSNPFHSKRRAREAEDKIKMLRMQDKRNQEDITSTLHQSTKRIENAMTSGNGPSEVRDRYHNQQILEKSKRYQFENDEEDDEMEMEIDKNLDKIGQVSGRLKKLALTTGKEIDSQQNRIKRIEESTDDLDIRIHVNTTKLTNIR
ncbi:unnamed protein product [Kluyveromyces dobzhanskii CBS 2104]|uniref:Protein transport protein SEC9 n=1 Tax=Kluyveromyces dobzhanskii CBS 2104 TaxID=1427455 RepID=A0A0A8L3K2_9SACH|nr:unnamed protein product [Kluyveromyces dobzhanskii CBS 2104]